MAYIPHSHSARSGAAGYVAMAMLAIAIGVSAAILTFSGGF